MLLEGTDHDECIHMVMRRKKDVCELSNVHATFCAVLHPERLHYPTDESFEIFFRHWFSTVHFKSMQKHLQMELDRRVKSQGFISSVVSQVKGAMVANVDSSLQANVWCNYFKRRCVPQFTDYFVCRTADVNVGPLADPCWITFIGVPNGGSAWRAPPWELSPINVAALLDEVDAHGGIASLIAGTTF